MRFYLFFVAFIFAFNISAQPIFNGKVVDAETKEPLAFVNIVYGKHQGVTSNIDGIFSFPVTSDSINVKISFIGYKQYLLTVNRSDTKHFKIIYLHPQPFQLNSVTILPGKNPAERIINQVIKNRKVLDPEQHLKSFAYKSYNKMYFTAKTRHNKSLAKDSIPIALDSTLYTNLPDSSQIKKNDTAATNKMERFLQKRHFLMMETISQRYYKAPQNDFEKIIASKVSGFTMPTFVILATQLQSFSFYKTQLNLLDKHYLSPISKNSPKNYLFVLKDTIFTESDTVYIIAFRPHKGKNFNGLKGLLYIKTPDYAIQNVIAQPMEQGDFFIKIQQQYNKIDDLQWMPTQLNADLVFNNMLLTDNSKDNTTALVGINKTYLYDIFLNPNLDTVTFSSTSFKVEKKAFKQPDSFWQKNRIIPLTKKEQETYYFIDSIGIAEDFDRKFRILKLLTTGKIPLYFVNINILKFFKFNEYEGLRPQLDLESNEKISKWFTLNGYLAYGSKDKNWKYGGGLSFEFSKIHNLKLQMNYRNDVSETGGLLFYDYKPNFSSSEIYREMLINNMFHQEVFRSAFSFRTIRYLKGEVYIQKRFLNTLDSYCFLETGNNVSVLLSQVTTNELGIRLRYAFKEKQAQMVDEIFALHTKYPILWFNFTKGITYKKTGLNYNKAEFQILKYFEWKKSAITEIKLTAGIAEGEIPIWLQFNANAAYYPFSLETANSFATMRMNEFFSDRFIAFYFSHNFKSLVFKTRFFAPQIKITYHAEFGTMKNSQQHSYMPFNTLEKGYYETGLIVNNILKFNLYGIGVGSFYRFGPYEFHNFKDNLAIKLSLSFNFD